MGCSSSSAQTVEQEKRPGTKPEESHGDTPGESPSRCCFGERESGFAQACAPRLVLLRGVRVARYTVCFLLLLCLTERIIDVHLLFFRVVAVFSSRCLRINPESLYCILILPSKFACEKLLGTSLQPGAKLATEPVCLLSPLHDSEVLTTSELCEVELFVLMLPLKLVKKCV